MVSPYTNSHRFGLDGPRDLLEKLWYDIGRMRAAESVSREDLAYVAFDCAVTAWSMVDWIAHAMDAETSNRLGLPVDYGRKKKEGIRALLAERIPDYDLCYQLATRAKHFVVAHMPRPEVETANITVRTSQRRADTGEIERTFSHAFFLHTENGSVEADAYFAEVYFGLERFITTERIDVRPEGPRAEIDWRRYDEESTAARATPDK